MKNRVCTVAALVFGLASISFAIGFEVEKNQKQITGITPQDVRWFTPPYYTDGRQRAHMLGDSSQGGQWVDRTKIPKGARVLAHTHPQDEIVTVIEGTWYLGEGEKFDVTKLKAYPAGSFVVIPAGVPHFVATKDDPVIVQLSGNEKFGTNYLEKE
jgi:quercetin dioxygenase-like cupin family protein